jgi:hypothetical protein
MESPRERACPSCGAPAAGAQRWCLECGHELPSTRRAGIRSAVGIATTLAVLVGAASAGAYTILQDDKVPPPPATTVAQAPATTPSASLPPATQESAPYSYTPPTTLPNTSSSNFGHGPRAPVVPLGGRGSSTNGGGTISRGAPGSGSVEPETHTTTTAAPPPKPQFALTDIALGAAAVAYAPYATPDTDLGDPSRAVDGALRTAWKAPAAADPTAPPQLGIYVDLAGKEKLRRLELTTPTPGMTIEIYGAKSGPPAAITDAGWDHLASRSGIAAHTKVKLGDLAYRYVLVWIVGAPPDAARPAISELSLLSLQPE